MRGHNAQQRPEGDVGRTGDQSDPHAEQIVSQGHGVSAPRIDVACCQALGEPERIRALAQAAQRYLRGETEV